MNKTTVVKRWVRKTGAADIFGGQDQAFSIGWKLLNAYLYFLETGVYIEDEKELYDLSCFMHEFADRYAGRDDELYGWLTKYGDSILEKGCHKLDDLPNSHCPLCGKRLNKDSLARESDGSIRMSVAGRVWCAKCAAIADQKKWQTS